MFKDARRALYIFLCGLMGSLLFLVIQRSLLLIYLILVQLNPDALNLGLSVGDLIALDLLTVFLALSCGGWYGIWLGLHWYDIVYEKKTFPGLGMHLAEVFSISNLRITVPGNKEGKQKFADFWEISDLVAVPEKNELKEDDTKVVHIKPKARAQSSLAASKKKTAVKKPAAKAQTKVPVVKKVLKKQTV